ncbi:arylsulfotransferase family protein [Halobacterium zhouii]|uniref:arylsulfotransferase family protein n=1 Tax=Halobacterium zhouii TaxID=2902624 RepID=UPI001E431E2F|nr:arylsulfotransferase family protein [Halobacterium zhouii]
MRRATKYRAVFASVILVSSALLVASAVPTAAENADAQAQSEWNLTVADGYNMSNPQERSTVVTAHITGGDIWQYSLNGTLLYHNDTHDAYWDVDPLPNETNSVVYVATDEVYNESLCHPVGDDDHCIRHIIERANLTTGETEVLYSRVDATDYRQWHDADRIGDSRYIVADMYSDEVFVVNTTTGIVTWEWNLQNNFSLASGGTYPDDWSHTNDVEKLADGRVMLSPRNHDQVLFVDPQTGLQENWTIGADDRFSVLDGQHNPDYFNESAGGPAVVIADSNNDRIIEYARTEDGGWEQSWVWQDERLTWPRDADRLPNGHTLITDTRGGRVVEVDEQGEIVWNLTRESHSEGGYAAYEAERLNTGDESAGGESADSLGLQSRTPDDGSQAESILGDISNSVSSVTPAWIPSYNLLLGSLIVFTALAWFGIELWNAGYRPQQPLVRQ